MKTKLNFWDNELLGDSYVSSGHIKDQIEDIAKEADEEKLPPSIIPTGLLYNIVCTNIFMYNLLLDSELIKTGNKRQDFTKIH